MVAAEEAEDSDPCHLLVVGDDDLIAKNLKKQIKNWCIFKKICRMKKRLGITIFKINFIHEEAKERKKGKK